MTSWSPTSASHANSRAGIGWEELVGARNTCSGAGYTSPFFLSFGGDAKRALAANGSMDWSARRNPVVCVPHPAARPPITLRGSCPFSRLRDALREAGGELPDLRLP